MKEGERYPFLKDDWADIHWIEVRAYTPGAAFQKSKSVIHLFTAM